ncbi:DIS3-like exonuclease 1 [Marchantia polymorpha subsp. ruderalis]|uniref:DIS3-like exonuclease 1 n=2 Tax=Marchantia polymorpha TaxID=3197 RepID=A0AAF6B233_MARPO|nr:hypothetical protein MARPO_0140s0030 [Marchantia polymorpha]BBN06067.1 hypothetical protein Mp_3g18110 [Marchantia polymorpha subsp. ruderalis]|eukprot:PTQ29500.1 hypothetical protein MARPO_0140s0030 [Marchantia polymorpha]
MNQEVTRKWLGRQVTRRCKLRKRSKTVVVLIQEVYLRDDIPCGSSVCQLCSQNSATLPAHPSHYLILDAEALIHYLEVWELPQITGVIYLSSVVKEVVNRLSQHNYRKFRSLFTDRRRQSILFDDEHFIYTWSLNRDRNQAAGAIHSGKRVEAVAGWFYEHLEGSVQIVAIQTSGESDSSAVDETFLQTHLSRLSISDGKSKTLEVLNVENYIKGYWNHDSSVSELFASLVQSRAEVTEAQKLQNDSRQSDVSGRRGSKGTSAYFKEHLPVHSLEADIASGSLRVGIFHVDRHEPLEGFIHPSNKGEASKLEIFVPGRLLQNRALPGDTVAVRMLESKYWQASRQNSQRGKKAGTKTTTEEDLKLPYLTDEVDDLPDTINSGIKQVDDVQEKAVQEVMPTGEVVGIVQRFQRDYVACLAQEDEEYISHSIPGRREYLLCVPMDRRIPMVRLNTRFADRLLGQRFVIRIDGWDQDSRVPKGHFVRLLGPLGDLNTETMALLVENGINTSPFSSASKQELPEDTESNPWLIPDKEFAYRRDLRYTHRTCSIDPPGSKDVDDALSVSRLSSGLLEIGVHIADVSYFVRQDSLLDLEARARGTTVYMVGKSWHMLPSILSENLCSLKGGTDRLAVSVVWTVDPENFFEIVDVWFGRTIIRSKHQMFYAQAQAIVDRQTLPSGWEISGGQDELAAVESDLLVLASFSQLRRDLRKAHGALELVSSELRFETAGNKEPISVDTKEELPMNWIVAELMILANSYVAKKIYGSFPSKALLRRHAPPRLDNFTLLLECCAARGFTLDTSSNKALANSLDRMRDSNDPLVESAFRALATRAMSEAEYCSTGEQSDASGVYHYGLALEFYTHFTSPIRRYADVIVHRMLLAACGEDSDLVKGNDVISAKTNLTLDLPSQELQEVVHHLNERHRNSKRAQKECNELYLLMFLQKHAKAEHAVVISIFSKGMMVFVPKYDLRVPVYLQDKKGNVILPAEDDSELDTEELFSRADSHILVKEPGVVKINDSKIGKTIREYRLMDSVWVQLRADGSRAHAPKLRVRLLSPTHPDARASKLLSSTRNQKGIPSQLYTLSGHSVPDKRGPRRAVKKSTVKDKKQALQDIVKMVAVEEALQTKPIVSTELDSLKRKGAMSVHDVAEDFKRLKVASIYLDVESSSSLEMFFSDVSSAREQGAKVFSNLTLTDGENVADWMPLTSRMDVSEGSLQPEPWFMERLRTVRERTLDRAAKMRATNIWSTLPNDTEKLKNRAKKEMHHRGRAHVFSIWLE